LKTLAYLRQQAHRLNDSCFKQVVGLVDIVVSAKDESGRCDLCEGPMRVQKTFEHEGRTIEHGTFNVQETVYVCGSRCRNDDGTLFTRRAESVVRTIMPNGITGYDVMVCVGLKRLLEHKQREEIKAEVKEKHGIKLSSGEISNLTGYFLEYLLRLHHVRADQLKGTLEADGGWPMQVDATGEAGRGTLFVVMAGWRKWVLGAWKIATERADLLLPCMRDTARRFGSPCGAMRDLGRAVSPAIDDLVSELQLDIPVLACHQHFLADIGKDLLEPDHSALRKLFRRTKVRPEINNLVREIGRKIGFQINDARQAVLDWQAMDDYRLPPGRDGLAVVRNIAQWILDYKADLSGLDFPFDRPYLSFYNRCMVALRAIDAFLGIPPNDRNVVRTIRRLRRTASKVSCEVPFRQTAKRLHCRADLFDELRDQLRLAKDLPEKESIEDIDDMRHQFEVWTSTLENRGPKRGPGKDIRDAVDIILKHIDTHGDNLWGHAIRLPESAGGGIRLMSRTNELLENFFGTMKHGERRRSGRKNLGQDLEHLPAEAALAYNLEHDDYVNIVCGSIEQLPLAFAQLDMENRNRKKRWRPSQEVVNLQRELQLPTASLSPADRRLVRTDLMNQRINKAAGTRAPRKSH
jgi:hypothetical protein